MDCNLIVNDLIHEQIAGNLITMNWRLTKINNVKTFDSLYSSFIVFKCIDHFSVIYSKS